MLRSINEVCENKKITCINNVTCHIGRWYVVVNTGLTAKLIYTISIKAMLL
jgi:hypothetical protein